MKNYFQRSRKITLFSNVIISLLCTSYLFTGYCNPEINNDVHHEKTAKVIENDMEAVSQLGKKSNKTNKVTAVVIRKEVNNYNKQYVPAKYNEVTGSAIVSYAKKYLGLRYVSGGNSLSTGTDCSGFTKLIYSEFGVSLSRTVRSQVNNGSYVKKSDLQKGDLVFYSKSGSTPSHVAIYIGNGQVIHESNHRDGVKISSVNMMTYITARRVINQKANEIAQDKIDDENKENDINDVTNNTNSNANVNNSVNNSNTGIEQEKVEQDNASNDTNNNVNFENDSASKVDGSDNTEIDTSTSNSDVSNDIYTNSEY